MKSKKYQIFVSSTFEDLREERSLAFETILKLGHIPVGMEYFTSANRNSAEVVKLFLDQSDYQVTVIGSRYGTFIDGTQTSFTEMEYDYATNQGIPQIAFIQQIKGQLLYANESDKHRRNLTKFRSKVESNRLIQRWTSPSSLALAISIALPSLIHEVPRSGWTQADSKESSLDPEINRLKAEVKGTRIALDRYRRNVVENNRSLIEQDLLESPSVQGKSQCNEKPMLMDLLHYAGAVAGNLNTGAFKHIIHGVCTSHNGEIAIQVWRTEIDRESRKDLRTTIMHGVIILRQSDSIDWETFSSRGDADLWPDFTEKLTWRRINKASEA